MTKIFLNINNLWKPIDLKKTFKDRNEAMEQGIIEALKLIKKQIVMTKEKIQGKANRQT